MYDYVCVSIPIHLARVVHPHIHVIIMYMYVHVCMYPVRSRFVHVYLHPSTHILLIGRMLLSILPMLWWVWGDI